LSSIHVARQPIFEHGHGLFGYELLYRRDSAVGRADGDDLHMSAEVIVSSLLGIGLHNIAGSGLAFVNFSRAELLNESWRLLDPNAVVIELLETVERTEETIAACRRMVNAGFRLALDDYVYDQKSTALLDLASIVKLDVLGYTPSELERVTRQVVPSGVRLLAERVETAVIRDRCVDLGYQLFQGYLFSKPETLTKTDVNPGQLAIMRLLNLLQDPMTTDSALEAAFQGDLGLCYKLLRIVNAAAMGGGGISSVPHAVRLVGRETLHRWLAVILVASLGTKGDITQELALTAICRARMCELLASRSHGERRHTASAFIVGLLSLLDVLLEVPMDTILSRLELTSEVRGALLQREGPLGTSLRIVEQYEHANWDGARQLATASGVSDDALPDLYIDALQWAGQHVNP